MDFSPDMELAVFDAVRQMEDARARQAFLDWVFRDDPEAGERMRKIVDGASASEKWFQVAATKRTQMANAILETGGAELDILASESSEALGLLGSTVGRYQIRKRLGEGGGGVVFLAEQLEPVRRLVAFKVLRLGMDTPAFLSAFQRERQALAMMNHPNIAGILDAGATENGRPYFVMELVEGEKITTFCDGHKQTLRQRLVLFLQVCAAIQHAHQKGIIHRDIKPSNILVSHGELHALPKVIDFGIASAVAEGGGDPGLAVAAGTPAYMSPEQATPGGIDVDTRADVFSLGVVLFELLVGLPLRDGTASAPRAALPRPSDYLAGLGTEQLAALAALRQVNPGRYSAALAGDLDAIVMKAVAPDRLQRYDSVNSLAMDIQRHLDNQPVLAHPPGARYSIGKFIRRNRLACVSALTILSALVLATVFSFGSYLREHEARKDGETARTALAVTLRQAEARETIAKVAILLSQNQVEQADSLLSRTPLASVEPSLEAATVFRFLGERNALLGRWKQASECFLRLMEANKLDPPGRIAGGMDLLLVAPSLLESGDETGYDQLRRDMLIRFDAPKDPAAAEHVIKTCLLRPANPAMLKTLGPVSEKVRRGFAYYQSTGQESSYAPSWLALAAALYHYRNGEFPASLDWAQKSLATKSITTSCQAAALLVSAMAQAQLGRPDEARLSLDKASGMLEASTPRVIVKKIENYNPGQGTWYSWAVARILRREAASMLDAP